MEAKRFKIRLIAIVLAMPMLFVACNSDEPMLTPEEEFAIKNGSDVGYVKPITFETENTDWFTEYNAVKNIYTTKICAGVITYKIKEGYHVPDIKVKKIVKEQDGKFENVEISEIKEDGFPMYEAEILNITQKSEDTFEISLSRVSDPESEYYTYNYRYYHIYLSDSEDIYGTKIVIDDNNWECLVGGISPIEFDLSGLKYPSKRHYHKVSGSKFGHEYSIYLPAEKCELELFSPFGNYSINSIMLNNHEIYDFKYNYDYDQYHEINQKPTTVIVECGEFICDYTMDSNSSYYSFLKCKITRNETGEERIITVSLGGPPCAGVVNFIQAAK